MPNKKPNSFPPILYQDQDILVIDKPAGLIVQKSHTHDQITLEQLLPEIPEVERKGIVHRLDRDTSGVMVVAQTLAAQENLYHQFQDRLVDKMYEALVWGKPKENHFIIDAPIARHPRYGHKYTVMAGGREARTEIWVQSHYTVDSDIVTKLKIKLYTGRTHQARVHLHALGHPMVGDKVYGRRKDQTGIRQFLHASSLSFNHPSTGDRLNFESPLPDELAAFLESLEKA